ncbi:MAG: nuclear transport factor 2 family protein [Proteobacteria bacterium]|jgi:phenylpyruvate tautomerase PptA (4-oxalocrotonate tautomerase family)|nr:nuclear transport factor 2 family protein [Paracoccaceae bacterium]MDA0318894.1 nuclear transport factor 2 family protein [Pseudomonadota bacterium]MDA0850951.1 nuclear transport factor 2 family protein [Pseudomonadota bacterium]MDA1295313.1 nuclear transport factor 2 family protein [Pseudomonadota bacterium]
MPVVKMTLIKGYSADVRRRMSQNITDLIVQMIGAVPEGTTVMIDEVDQASYMRGRENKNPIPTAPAASEIVKSYLDAMEARDLTKAASFLSDGFWMEFPGPVRMRTLQELIDWSKPRYQKIAKTYFDFSEAYREQDTLVTCHGVLHGIWPDGAPFQDIRFIDQFTVAAGKITSQMVWNDLAETKNR